MRRWQDLPDSPTAKQGVSVDSMARRILGVAPQPNRTTRVQQQPPRVQAHRTMVLGLSSMTSACPGRMWTTPPSFATGWRAVAAPSTASRLRGRYRQSWGQCVGGCGMGCVPQLSTYTILPRHARFSSYGFACGLSGAWDQHTMHVPVSHYTSRTMRCLSV